MLPRMTFEATLVDDPELRFTPGGKAVANFRVAANKRKRDENGQWVDAEAVFLSCSVWDQQAENVVNSLKKGDRVVIMGELRQRQFETREGEKRTVVEVQADTVAPSLRYVEARLTRVERSGVSSGETSRVAERVRAEQNQPEEPPY